MRKPLETNNRTQNTHTKTIRPVGANNGHHTHHPSHQSANPSHRSETHAAELKPRPPIKKSSSEQTHSKKIITEATKANPFKKKSSPKPPSELPMINPTDPPIDQPIQTYHQLIPAHRSKPSSPIHANPTSKIQNPGDGDEASEMRK